MNDPTWQEILDLLPIIAHRGWTVDHEDVPGLNFIRDRDGFCPLCALANEIDPKSTEKTMYWETSLGEALTHPTLAAAADYAGHSLRAELEVALGMK